jgi:hypothetical protein
VVTAGNYPGTVKGVRCRGRRLRFLEGLRRFAERACPLGDRWFRVTLFVVGMRTKFALLILLMPG